MTKNKKTIVICSSCAFYTQVLEMEQKLKALGFKVEVPLTAKKMKKSGDFKVETYKPWVGNEEYKRKAYLTEKHFKEVERGDIILVLNYKKNNKNGYIGGAVLSEMAVAFYLKKPIYVLNPIDENSSFKEEIYGFQPVILNGDLNLIK